MSQYIYLCFLLLPIVHALGRLCIRITCVLYISTVVYFRRETFRGLEDYIKLFNKCYRYFKISSERGVSPI